MGVGERWLFDQEPGCGSAEGDEDDGEQGGAPGVDAVEAGGDDDLDDGPVEDVGAVGEVSPAGGALDDGKQERGAHGEGGDGDGAGEEPAGVGVQGEEECGAGHQELAVLHEEGLMVLDERADHEEGELTGELDGELGVFGGGEQAEGDGGGEEGPEDGIAMEPTAEPDDDRDREVEHDFDLDGPERAVHDGVGVGLEDAFDARVEVVGEAEVGEQELADVEAAGGCGDGEAEDRGEPVAGKDAPGALAGVVGERGAALVAGEDEEAGDGEETFDGDVKAEQARDDREGLVLADGVAVEQHDHAGEEEADDIEVVLAHWACVPWKREMAKLKPGDVRCGQGRAPSDERGRARSGSGRESENGEAYPELLMRGCDQALAE